MFSLLPILCLAGLGLVLLIVDSLQRRNDHAGYWVTIFGLAACILASFLTLDSHSEVSGNMIIIGGYSHFFGLLFLISALLTVVLSKEYLQRAQRPVGGFCLLVIFATIGMMLIASAGNLIMVFLGIELMSISLYVLAGFFRDRVKSNESSLKYFLLGAFATGFLLYGIALIYGASGTTSIALILEKCPALSASKIFWSGIALLFVGLAFKVAAVPFHMWVPDVYEGAPTPVSGFMSTGAKAAAFSAIVMIFARPFVQGDSIKLVISITAAASMILGNIVAVSQTNIKRMLAYSSIAHAGYMLAGVAAANQLGRTGVLFYLIVYTFMNVGAFGVISLLESEEERFLSFGDYSGLAKTRPFLAALMAVFMFSLSGIPPFAGFLGKYYVFAAAVNAHLTWLAIIGVLTSVVGVYYYLRLVVVMYFDDREPIATNPSSIVSVAALGCAAVVVIYLGIFPSWVIAFIDRLF